MNQSLEKGPDESQEDYDARLKKLYDASDREASRQAGEAKKWKNKAIAALIAAVLLFLLLIGYALFWNDGAQVKQVRETAAGEVKTLKAEIERLKAESKSCQAPAPSSEVTALGKALSECLAKLPNGLPYQPTAPAAAPAPAPKQEQKKREQPKAPATPPREERSSEVCTNQKGVNQAATKNSRGCTCYIDNKQGNVLIDFFADAKVRETMKGAECTAKKDAYVASIGKPKVGQVDQEHHRSWKKD